MHVRQSVSRLALLKTHSGLIANPPVPAVSSWLLNLYRQLRPKTAGVFLVRDVAGPPSTLFIRRGSVSGSLSHQG